MPLGCRNIEPISLGAHSVPQSSEEDLKCVHLTVANNAIVGTLLQLSSLVRHADDLFCDISDECQKVFERTDRIKKKLKAIGDRAAKLDAKKVKVPESDLKSFSEITTYFEARHGYNSHLFMPTNRPQCIQDQYNLCQPNPARVIRSADLYRKDGLSGSKMFKCWPVILNEQTVRTPDLSLPRRETKVHRVRSFEKKYKKLKIRERPKTIHGCDDFSLQDSKNGRAEDGSPKTPSLTENQAPVVVSIDTSGSNFERMQSVRLSGRRGQTPEEKEKKKRRRRTVSGVPENIVYEIERFEKKQKVHSGARHTPRSYSFDDLDAEDNDIERDERMVKYFNDIDGKIEDRGGGEKALKIMKFFPCRRSRSLPRCVKLASVTRSLSSERKSQRDMNCSYASSSLSLASMVSSGSRLSRSTKRSSIISNKIKSFVMKDMPRPRPKSLDLDTLFDSKSEKKSVKQRSKSSYSLERSESPQLPDNLLSKQFAPQTSESSIGPGTYYNFESSTLPRMQAKKYDFPWESLPKDWTTSVKLREISKRRAREDRQSSSGNWSQSGTSSNRQSLDSDIRGDGPPKFNSQYSLGRDSGRDSLTLEEEYDCVTDGTSTAGYAGDETSTIAGSSDSVSVGNPKSDFTDGDTQAWLQTLAIRAAKRTEVKTNDADALTSLSRLTRKNILALDLMLSDDKPERKITDEESSTYSVDQEGFYTSFHNDSGLKKSTTTLVDEELSSPLKDSSVCSSDSVIFNPFSDDKFAALRKGSSTSQSKVLSKVTPPTPPTRVSSNKNADLSNSDTNTSNVSDDTCTPPKLHSCPSVESSISESDQEAVFRRVKEKTQISSTTFPTLVALSASEDDSSPDTSSEKLRTTNLNLKGGLFNLDDTEQEVDSSCVLSTTGDTSSPFSLISYKNVSVLNSTCENNSSPRLPHSKSALECTDQGYDSLNLPKRSRNTSKTAERTEASYQSWPRSHKSRSPGILKTPEKPNGPSKAPKTLNFAPVVNLFKPGMPNSVEVPLPSPTNSSSSEGHNSSGLNTSSFKSAVSPDSSYKLSYPLEKSTTKSKMKPDAQCELPMKYQPVITVTPRSRSGDRQTPDRSGGYVKLTPDSNRTPIYAVSNAQPAAQSTPNVTACTGTSKTSPNLYAVSPVMAPKDPHNQNGRGDSGYMEMDKAMALRSMGSFSSLMSSEVSFGDNSTYVSMSSPCSSPNLSNMDFPMSMTPCGSVESLSDLRRTPTNGLENDTYQINTSIHGNVNNPSSAGKVVTVPVVTDSNTASYRPIQNGGGHKSMASFSASANSSINSSANNSYSSFGSTKTPVRISKSCDTTTDSDLTKVTHLSQLSTPGSTVKSLGNTSEHTARQRTGRADTRHEPSYRSNVQANRRSLPSDSSQSMYGNNPKLAGLKDNILPNKMSSPKAMTSSRSYPSGIGSADGSQYKPGPAASHTQGRSVASHGKYVASPVSPASDPTRSDSRSDSYRVALKAVGKRHSSPATGLTQSKSSPVFPISKQSGPYRVAMDMNPKISVDDDVMCRADSYRIAVRNTNGLVPDIANRNTSYRVAVADPLSAINAKIESLTFVNQKSPSTGHVTSRAGVSDGNKARGNVNKVTMRDTKVSPQTDNQRSGRIRKVTKTDVDPIQILSSMDYNRNDTRKADKNNQNRSSTYIQFDPIFEDTEDFTNSTESLRMAALKSPMLDTVSQKSINKSPILDNSSRNSSALKASGGKSKHSLMNGSARESDSNIRTVKSSKTGKPIEIEDNWRYSQV